jgi:hypothetical protein
LLGALWLELLFKLVLEEILTVDDGLAAPETKPSMTCLLLWL